MLSTRNLSLPKKAKSKQILSQKMGGKKCFRCGSPRHLADKCSHVASACNCCVKPGHLAKKRFKKRREELGGNNTTHQVSATPTSGTWTKEEQENSALSRIVFYVKSAIFWKFVNYNTLIQTYRYNSRPGSPYGS